jgi:hypothetical protein
LLTIGTESTLAFELFLTAVLGNLLRLTKETFTIQENTSLSLARAPCCKLRVHNAAQVLALLAPLVPSDNQAQTEEDPGYPP